MVKAAWLYLNPMRTTCRLVKMNILSFIESIREGVRNNSLICKLLMLHIESLIMIGLKNDHFMIWTNQNSCYTAGSAQGVKSEKRNVGMYRERSYTCSHEPILCDNMYGTNVTNMTIYKWLNCRWSCLNADRRMCRITYSILI